MPPVVCLLPMFNAAETLAACLASIKRQAFADFDCLIVDDGSTDDSLAIAARTCDADARFRLVSRPHAGLVATLNAGLSQCRAPLIARMDADDVMHRERLRMQVAALERDETLSGVGCGVRMWPRAGLRERRRDYERWLNGLTTPALVARDALVECPVAHPALMVRREVLEQFGYRDEGWPEDYDLVLRLLAAGHRLANVPARLLMWRDRPARLSRVDARYGLARFTACKAHFLAQGFLSGGRDYVLWGYGATGKALRRALLAHGPQPSHIVEIKRGRIGQRIHGTPVVSPEALTGMPGVRIVVSVAFEGPRTEIRARLAAMGFAEGRDFVCAA